MRLSRFNCSRYDRIKLLGSSDAPDAKLWSYDLTYNCGMHMSRASCFIIYSGRDKHTTQHKQASENLEPACPSRNASSRGGLCGSYSEAPRPLIALGTSILGGHVLGRARQAPREPDNQVSRSALADHYARDLVACSERHLSS